MEMLTESTREFEEFVRQFSASSGASSFVLLMRADSGSLEN